MVDAVENMDNQNSIDTLDMIDKKEPLDTIEVNDNDSSVIKKRKESTNFTLQEGIVIKEDDNENFDLETNSLEDDNFDNDDNKVRKRHFCQICNRSFRDSWKLKRHEKVHKKADELSEPPDFPLKEGMEIKKEFQNEKSIDTHNDLDQKSAQIINQPLSDSLNRKKSSNMSGKIIQRGEK